MNAIAPVESPLEWRSLAALLCYMLLTFYIIRLFLSLPLWTAVTVSAAERRCESRSPSPKFDINADIIKRRKRGRLHIDRGHSNSRSASTSSALSSSTEVSFSLLTILHTSKVLIFVICLMQQPLFGIEKITPLHQ